MILCICARARAFYSLDACATLVCWLRASVVALGAPRKLYRHIGERASERARSTAPRIEEPNSAECRPMDIRTSTRAQGVYSVAHSRRAYVTSLIGTYCARSV